MRPRRIWPLLLGLALVAPLVACRPASGGAAPSAGAEDPLLAGADRLRRSDPDAADRMLAAALASEPDADRRARIAALRARIDLAAGRTRQAVAGLRRAFDAARAAGRMADAAHDGFALAHALIMSELDLVAARALLGELGAVAAELPEARAELAYYRGLLGLQSGDLRSALGELRAAEHEATRLDRRALAGYAGSQIGITLATLGRTREALAVGTRVVRERALHPPAGAELPCNRAEPYVDRAWIALLAWRAQADVVDPGPLLAEARRALTREGCRDPLVWRNARLDEALYAIGRGDVAGARARLDEIGDPRGEAGAPAPPYLAVWQAEASGRLALAEGRPARALDFFAREAALARAAGLTDGVLRAETGLGRAEQRRGRRREAGDHLQAARAAFEEIFRSIPLGEGRDSFLHSNQESARLLVTALYELGRARDAFVVARLERARLLASVTRSARLAALSPAQRARWDQALAAYRAGRAALDAEAARDWERPADALARERARRATEERVVRAHLDDAYRLLGDDVQPPALSWPRAGELYLGYAPIEGGWLGLAATGDHTIARRLPPGRWLAPFAVELARAHRITVFPPPALAGVDLHRLLAVAAKGRARAQAIVYGADAPAAVEPGPGAASGPALIVDDPTEDLGAARAEGAAVGAAMRAGGLAVEQIEGERATRDRLVAGLSRARVFHFAGHAVRAGVEGSDSALPLAGGGHLSFGDVLALPAVPALVTLAACDAAGGAARDDEGAGAAPLGLAEAFLAAGAQVVLAPTRPVDDGAARALMADVYRQLAQELSTNAASPLSEALITAASRSLARSRNPDVAAFRILVP